MSWSSFFDNVGETVGKAFDWLNGNEAATDFISGAALAMLEDQMHKTRGLLTASWLSCENDVKMIVNRSTTRVLKTTPVALLVLVVF